MLSSQTRDEVTYAAVSRLKTHGLTIENILQTDTATLEELIKPVGFYKRKADYIKRASKMMQEHFHSDVPNNIEDVLKLPGVGPKMGYLALANAWGINSGIGEL
jgi:endonuclease-3